MAKLILILFIVFLLGFLYGFFIKDFSKSRLLAFLPSILGLVFLIYTNFLSPTKTIPGQETVEAIKTLFKEFIIVAIILGNLLGYGSSLNKN